MLNLTSVITCNWIDEKPMPRRIHADARRKLLACNLLLYFS